MKFKQYIPDVLVVLAFVLISFAYFFPSDIEGRILYQHDASAGRGSGMEIGQYRQTHNGEISRWTNALFCGMPTYQSAPSYDSASVLNTFENALHLWLPAYVWYVFVYLLGFYILLRAFNFRQSLAALGSIIWAFSSYFFIIIAAGHIWKVMTLAYIPPTIAGIVLAYRGKYLWGGIVTAIFVALQIKSNHVQMSYYFLSVILFMFLAYLVDAIKNKTWKNFIKASAVCILGALLGIAINSSNLYHTYEYSKETMRGKSELKKADAVNQTGSGLERDYITAWSYGISETWTLLVPNAKGGASSVTLSQSEPAMKKADPNYYSLYQQMGQYWGNQPGTSGPVYVGAFVLFLFILGLFIVKGPLKWALLAATILSVLLAWGKNFMGFTDFFIDHVPMYAKFRTVASILVVAEFTIPLLGMFAMKEWMEGNVPAKKLKVGFWVALIMTAGMSFLFAIAPGVCFSQFISDSEMHALTNAIPSEQLSPILANIVEMRKAMLSADAWRSFVIIIIGVACLLLYKSRKLKAQYAVGAIIVLCLIDMWQVNKRYLNDDMFVSKTQRDMPQEMTQTDQIILQDKSLDYRVLNFASNTFNENETSYYHKSIGGYHAAKLRRYQELIEAYISPEMQKTSNAVVANAGDFSQINGDSIFPVLNMLNAKYFIFPLKEGATIPLQNPYAMGNAWFVDNVEFVDNANDELSALRRINLHTTAVADSKYKECLEVKDNAEAGDTTASVSITAYEPNQLNYDVNSKNGGVIVFSEIYYPGWKATVDGKEVEIGRVNYVLRAIRVEGGSHKVELSFFPTTITVTDTIAYCAFALLILGIIFIILRNVYLSRKRKIAE